MPVNRRPEAPSPRDVYAYRNTDLFLVILVSKAKLAAVVPPRLSTPSVHFALKAEMAGDLSCSFMHSAECRHVLFSPDFRNPQMHPDAF